MYKALKHASAIRIGRSGSYASMNFVVFTSRSSDYFTVGSAAKHILSCQPRVTLTSCFVNKVIRDIESIDHLCINPIHRIGLIHK